MHTPRPRRALAAALLMLVCACADRNPLATEPTPPTGGPARSAELRCEVNVKQGTLSCAEAQSSSGARTTKILGGQDVYVKLASSGTSYDAGTQILQSNVTVQNLVSHLMGTTTGTDTTGIDVFFSMEPVVTSGTGSVTVANRDGENTFTDPDQDYFHYQQILKPYQISNARTWQFQISGTVNTFIFTVAVSANLDDEAAPLIDALWDGSLSSAWDSAANWSNNTVPGAASFVTVPSDSLFAGSMPVLGQNVQVGGVRVGLASTLDLNTFTLETSGTVDAVGTVSNGTIRMTGAGTYLGGNVGALEVTGSTRLQTATKATGAVAVSGSITVADKPLTVSIP